MRYVAPTLVIFSLVMACFTDPEGVLGIWVSKSQVVSVTHSIDCAKGASTKITLASGAICVKESPQEVLKRLGDD